MCVHLCTYDSASASAEVQKEQACIVFTLVPVYIHIFPCGVIHKESSSCSSCNGSNQGVRTIPSKQVMISGMRHEFIKCLFLSL